MCWGLPRRFTPTGVGTMIWIRDRPRAFVRFTPTGVGTMEMGVNADVPSLRFTPTGVGTIRKFKLESYEAIRFTPTGVGTIPPSKFAPWVRGRFTPTGVGTMFCALLRAGGYFGSPPRVWGQCSPLLKLSLYAPVHPHGCGDNQGQE